MKNGRLLQSEIEIIASKALAIGVQYAVVGRDSGQTSEDAAREIVAMLRDELYKAGALTQVKRRAHVKPSPGATLAQVQHYLPSNFTAHSIFARHAGCDVAVVIEGYDRAGWTLDGYVIPRLASGLIVAKEVK